MEITGFLFFLLLFVAVGLWSTRQQTVQENDFLLAGGTVSPLLTALSAAASAD